MKFKIPMRDREAVETESHRAVMSSLETMDGFDNLDEEEVKAIARIRTNELREVLQQWFEDCEYLTVEVDTEANTCTVVQIPVG